MNAEDTKLPVRTELRNHTFWIWIDREERRNAINKGVISGIQSALVAHKMMPACAASFLPAWAARHFAPAPI